MSTENSETAGPAAHPWAPDVRRMFDSPDLLAAELPALSEVVRAYLAAGVPVRQRYVDELLVAALAHGESTEPQPSNQEERKAARHRKALREGVRGTFFLRTALDDSEADGQPAGPEDEALVYGDDGRKDTVTEHRRWAGLRFGRADGRRGKMTPGTVAKWGASNRSAFEARLADDLEAFLADGQAQRDFVDAVVPLGEQSLPFREADASRTVPSERRGARAPHRLLLDQLASRLDEPSAAYPRHLTPTVLARELTLSRYARPVRGDQDEPGLYVSTKSHGGRHLREVLADERRVVVVGNPGGGKSTVLAAEVAERVREGEPALMVRLSSVAPRLEGFLSFAGALETLIAVALEDGGLRADAEDAERLMKTIAKEPSALIALDGLDEVHADDLEGVWTLCRVLEALPGTVVISSRVAGYVAPPGEWTEHSVDNLSARQASSFLESWFDGANDEGKKRADAAVATAERGELAEIPVLLGIIASVAEDDDVPETEAALYDRYVSLFLRGRWKPRAQWLKVEHLPRRLSVASELAWQMATGFTGRTDGVRWSDTVPYSAVIDKATTATPRLARLMVGHHGLFTPHGRSASELHQRYRWLHRTIHEHLVGAYLADLIRSDQGKLALRDEILMGPKQWDVPLLHMFGLLGEDDQLRVMGRLDELRAEGDPGLVLDAKAELLAEAAPVGSAPRRREAERMAARADWRGAYNLDSDLWFARLPDLISSGDHEIREPENLFGEQHPPPEGYTRDVIARLLAASTRNRGMLACAIRWLATYDADAAVDALLAASADPGFSPEFRWEGDVPSAEAAARAVAEVSTWPRGERRLTFLYRMATVGVDLRTHAAPRGPLDPDEVAAAAAIGAYFTSTDDSKLPVEVHRAVLTGAFGDHLSAAAGRWDGANRVDRSEWAAAALLLNEASELRSVRPEPGEVGDPSEAAALLDTVSEDNGADPVQLRRFVAAADACVRASSRLTTGWGMRTYWAIWNVYWRLEADGRANTGSPLLAITDALEEIVAAKPAEARRAVLASKLEDWIADARPSAAFGLIGRLYDTGVFSLRDVIELTVWAAKDRYVLLNTLDGLRLGSRVQEVAERLWEEAPDTLEVSEYALGRQLAELGQLVPWRDRLIAAKRSFESKHDADETAWHSRNRTVGVRR